MRLSPGVLFILSQVHPSPPGTPEVMAVKYQPRQLLLMVSRVFAAWSLLFCPDFHPSGTLGPSPQNPPDSFLLLLRPQILQCGFLFSTTPDFNSSIDHPF